jgi:hypothetical protein
MATSPENDWSELDRAADALVPSFRRHAGARGATAPAPVAAGPAEVAASPAEVAAGPEPAGLSRAAALNPDIPKPARVPDLDAITPAPEPEVAAFSAPRSERSDATPIAIPQVILTTTQSRVATQPDPHEAATVPPPNPAPAPKPKKQLRTAPEPSIKAEAGLHAPVARTALKEESAKIVFNDPQAPSRQATVAMAAVRLPPAEANRATIRPQRRRAAPLVPALLAAVALLGLAAVVMGTREESAAPKAAPSAAAAPAPIPEPAPAPPQAEPNVPPPPPEEEVAPESAPPAAAQAATPPVPKVAAAPKREPEPAPSPPVQPAAAKAAPAPAPVPAAGSPGARLEPAPSAPAAKPAPPPKAPNSSGSPAIVRDNPF